MRIFKVAYFDRYARKQGLTDAQLVRAVQEIEAGLINADLGGGLIKKRIAREGSGKSGGYRTILAYQKDERVFFLFGFGKNTKDNISKAELRDLKLLTKSYLHLKTPEIKEMIELGSLVETKKGNE